MIIHASGTYKEKKSTSRVNPSVFSREQGIKLSPKFFFKYLFFRYFSQDYVKLISYWLWPVTCNTFVINYGIV
jgi:hypothetical protein